MSKLGIPIFTATERRFLGEYVTVLKPIAVALDNLQRSKNSPYANVLPTLFKTEAKLNEIKAEGNLVHCKPLLNAVMDGFKKRFGAIMDFNNKDSVPALIATVSHPYFKLRWMDPELCTAEEKQRIINMLVAAADEISLELETLRTSSASHSNQDTESSTVKTEKDVEISKDEPG